MKTVSFSMDARAVDVGYSQVKFTLGQLGSSHAPVAVASFASIAPVLKTGQARSLSGTAQPDGCVADVGGVSYFVGPGAIHRCSGRHARLVQDGFATSPPYMALLRGALWTMAARETDSETVVIRCLGLGLPLNTYFDTWEALAARAVGEHVVGVGDLQRKIVVQDSRVIVQPAGTIFNFGLRNDGRAPEGVTLVVDAGGGTLDWYMSAEKNPYWERSGAHFGGMLACTAAVADRLDPRWKSQPAILDRIDLAIRENRMNFTVQGKSFGLADHAPAIDQVLDESLDQMFAATGQLDDVDHVLMTGGGAAVFRKRLLQRMPRLARITRMDPDPVFSNVRGFQAYAEDALSLRRGR